MLSETGTREIEVVLCAMLAVCFYAKSDRQKVEYIITLFYDQGVAVLLLKAGQNFHLLLKAVKSPVFSFRNVFHSFHVLHSLSVVSYSVDGENCRIAQVYTFGTLIVVCIYLLCNVLRPFIRKHRPL